MLKTIEQLSVGHRSVWCVYDKGADLATADFIPFATGEEAIQYCFDNDYEFEVLND